LRWVLRRVGQGKAEFTLMSLWDSWHAIQAFAGADYETAVYYPEAKKFLLEMVPQVEHHEILSAPRRSKTTVSFPHDSSRYYKP
jgi:hypothetical protein